MSHLCEFPPFPTPTRALTVWLFSREDIIRHSKMIAAESRDGGEMEVKAATVTGK